MTQSLTELTQSVRLDFKHLHYQPFYSTQSPQG
ncbi:hypothetical protein EMIT0P253_10373 [Pseudomonas sp. IT-P253]